MESRSDAVISRVRLVGTVGCPCRRHRRSPGGLAQHAPPVILDEVWYVPGLLSYIKEHRDARRERPGRYLLTVSQNFLLMGSITASLAGLKNPRHATAGQLGGPILECAV